ncbi:acyltransferase domain-containing protein [Trichoderma barbatum]
MKSITPKIFSSTGAIYFQQSEMRWLNYRGSTTTHLYRYVWQTMPLTLARAFCWMGGDHRAARQLTRATQNIDKLDQTFGYFLSNSFNFTASRPTLAQRAPHLKPEAYMQIIFRGAQQFMMRRTRERNLVSAERLIAGGDVNNGGENALKLFLTSRASTLFRLTAVIVGAALGRMFEKVTFDQQSFFDALEGYSSGLSDEKIVIMPTHRSYMDFVICPYLFYQFPVLGVKIPCIAAQDQFSRIPVVGWLLRRLGAFYIKRGVGRADPELNEHVRRLVEQDEHILFFPEGQRSRSREFLSPRRGLLRSLQSTGKSFKILPVSISYERVPEEGAFIREAQEQERPRMSLFALYRWTFNMILGRVKLGRVHVKCGKMLELNPETDVQTVLNQVMGELQANTVVTTYHLESFVNYHRRDCRCSPPCAISSTKRQPDAVNWIRKQLEERGATVLDGALSVDENHPLSPVLETSLMNQWIHFFDRETTPVPLDSAAVEQKFLEMPKCQSVNA